MEHGSQGSLAISLSQPKRLIRLFGLGPSLVWLQSSYPFPLLCQMSTDLLTQHIWGGSLAVLLSPLLQEQAQAYLRLCSHVSCLVLQTLGIIPCLFYLRCGWAAGLLARAFWVHFIFIPTSIRIPVLCHTTLPHTPPPAPPSASVQRCGQPHQQRETWYRQQECPGTSVWVHLCKDSEGIGMEGKGWGGASECMLGESQLGYMSD